MNFKAFKLTALPAVVTQGHIVGIVSHRLPETEPMPTSMSSRAESQWLEAHGMDHVASPTFPGQRSILFFIYHRQLPFLLMSFLYSFMNFNTLGSLLSYCHHMLAYLAVRPCIHPFSCLP